MAKIERFKKKELVAYCKSIGIDTDKKSMKTLVKEAEEYAKNQISN